MTMARNPEANKAMLFEIGDAVLRSWWTVVAAVCIGLTVAMFALSTLPKRYMATARILVTPQSIPDEFVQTTVTEDLTRRAMLMQDDVVGDHYMSKLVERVWGPQDSEESLQSKIRAVRAAVTVLPTPDAGMGVLAYDMTYRSPDQQRVALVVNTLAEMFCEENSDFRNNAARETWEAMERRAREAKTALEEINKRVSDFRARHQFETEAYLPANMSAKATLERDLDNNLEAYKAAEVRLKRLREELSTIDVGPSMLMTRLASLEQELDLLLSRYSEVHPDVVRKRREIADLRATVAAGGNPDDTSRDPRVVDLQGQIDDLTAQMTSLGEEQEDLRAEIAKYDRWIRAQPEVQPRLAELLTEQQHRRDRYTDLQAKADAAKESEVMERSRQGQQIELIERAAVPDEPFAPNPPKLIGVAIVAGFALFVGPLVARRVLNPLVASEAGLRAISEVPVLVSLPRIVTPANRGYAARRLAKNLGLSVASAAVLVGVILFVI
jgi:uncharacterized protein involved in exopolysaccharide biosynthesis